MSTVGESGPGHVAPTAESLRAIRRDLAATKHRLLLAQREWAARSGVSCNPVSYTESLAANLFATMHADTALEFGRGSGSEMRARTGSAKMQALHSSSALACNVFDYWRSRDRSPLAMALGLATPIRSIRFEQQLRTPLRGTPPNLDILLELESDHVIAVESKFTETYVAKKRRPLFADSYFPPKGALWAAAGLPACEALALALHRGERVFTVLDAAQLLKHALGLRTRYPDNSSLWYIWFDSGDTAAATHQLEVGRFQKFVGSELGFRELTYQQLFGQLAECCPPGSRTYIEYLQERYDRAL